MQCIDQESYGLVTLSKSSYESLVREKKKKKSKEKKSSYENYQIN